MGNSVASRAGKTKAIGPYSRDNALGKIDGRTKEARLIRETRAELVAHVGGAPSATQRALIERAVQLTLRIALMDQRFAAAGHTGEIEGKQYLAWSNALNRTMRELGFHPAARAAPSLADYLASSRQAAA